MDPAPPTAFLAPLGLRTCVAAADADLLAAVVDAFGPAEAGGAPGGPPPIALRIGRGRAAEDASPVGIRVSGGRLHLAGGGVSGEADAALGTAWCTVPESLAADPARLVAEVVDPLLLFLITRAGRVPVHGAGIVIGGTAAVLAGESGAGKSTLAHAAARAGLPVLSDDTVFVQLQPRLRVWGLARPIHLLAGEAPAGEAVAHRLRAGRWKHALPVPPGVRFAERAALCLLEHGPGPTLHPVSADEAVEWMRARVDAGFDHFREALPAVVQALATGGAWRLVLSRDPTDALALLAEALV